MIILRRAAAVLLIVVFAVLLLLQVAGRTADGSLLSPAFLKEQLARNDVYAFALREAVPQQLREDSTVLRDLPLTAQEVAELVQATIPEAYLREQVESAVDTVVPYVAGRSDEISLTVPLKERKRAFELALAALLIRKYDALPPCGRVADFRIAQEFPRCRVGDSSGNLVPVLVAEYAALPACSSPADLRFDPFPRCQAGAISPEVQRLLEARYDVLPACKQFQDIVTGGSFLSCKVERVTPERLLQLLSVSEEFDKVVPDQLTVTTADILENAPDLETVRQSIRAVRTLLWAGLALLAALLAASAFLGGRSWRGRLQWGGAAISVGGLLLLLVAMGGRSASARAINELASVGTGFSTQVEDKAFQVVQSAVNSIAGTIQLWAIILLAMGLLALVVPFFLRGKESESPALPKLPGT
ncbi:MAG: hypothetical protein HY330_06150 [Chloroflexi bacterium]|nr:hypothetical protein [Chloroflexota bacterium]